MNLKSACVGVVTMLTLMLAQSFAYGLPPQSEAPNLAERIALPPKPDLVVQIRPGPFAPSRFAVYAQASFATGGAADRAGRSRELAGLEFVGTPAAHSRDVTEISFIAIPRARNIVLPDHYCPVVA